MKMITLFLPEKYLEMLDTLVAANMYPNRSEALRMATWKFLHESVNLLKTIAPSTAADDKQEADPIDEAIGDLDADAKGDPFDELTKPKQSA